MKTQQTLDSMDLEHLQNLCDQCKLAIAELDNNESIGKALQDACSACQHVRSRFPDLVALRRTLHQFNTELDKPAN